MLDDRSYMRDPSGAGRSLTMILIVTLIGLFIVQACVGFYSHVDLDGIFALSVDGFKHKRFWQLLTFQFMHSTPWPWHVLFNCLALYFLGSTMEDTLGRSGFLKLYFGAGFSGGALALLTNWALPHHQDFSVLGASAGIMGLLAAYAIMFPMRSIMVFIWLIPVNIRVWYLFWFLLGISAFGTIVPFDGVAHAAHLGGLLFGVAFIRWGRDLSVSLQEWNPLQRKLRRERMIKAATVPLSKLRRRPELEDAQEVPSEEFISQQVDPILDKISAQGIQSLTEKERKILETARNKVGKQ